jgi:hypothetical protein
VILNLDADRIDCHVNRFIGDFTIKSANPGRLKEYDFRSVLDHKMSFRLKVAGYIGEKHQESGDSASAFQYPFNVLPAGRVPPMLHQCPLFGVAAVSLILGAGGCCCQKTTISDDWRHRPNAI